MTYTVWVEFTTGWSTGTKLESNETPAQLLTRLSREGVVIDRNYEAQYYAASLIKTLRIDKDQH